MPERVNDLLTVIRRDTDKRRQLGITLFLLIILAGMFFYLYLALKFVPDLGVRMLLGGALLLVFLIAGPRVTFPIYFATWFGTALPAPGLPVSLNKVVAVLFLVSWGISLLRERFHVKRTIPVLVLTAFTLYAVGTSLIHKIPSAAFSYQQVMYLLLTFATASMYREKKAFLHLIAVLLTITCAINSIGMVEFIVGRDLFTQFSDYTIFPGATLRINGIAKNAIQFAFTCTWILPWALMLHIESKSKKAKILTLLAMLFLIALSLLTLNRQSPIIIAAMLCLGLPLIRYRYRTILVMFLILAAIAVSPLVVGKIVSRFSSIASTGRPDMSVAIRRDKFVAAMDVIQDYPWLGIGLNNFKDYWWQYTPPGELYVIQFEKGFTHYVDLGYLQIITETGLLGTALFLLLAVTTFLLWLRYLRETKKIPDSFYRNGFVAAGMGFVQLCLSMMLQDTFFIPRTYLLFGLLFALITMYSNERKSQSEEEAETSP